MASEPLRLRAYKAWNMIRCAIVAPPPEPERCWMGGPVGDGARCPRRARAGELFCERHDPGGEWYRGWAKFERSEP